MPSTELLGMGTQDAASWSPFPTIIHYTNCEFFRMNRQCVSNAFTCSHGQETNEKAGDHIHPVPLEEMTWKLEIPYNQNAVGNFYISSSLPNQSVRFILYHSSLLFKSLENYF